MAKVTTAKNKQKQTKPAVAANVSDGPRRLKLPAFRPFRLKRIKYPEKLPSAWQLAKQAVRLFWSRRKLFIGITAIYALLTLILVRGFSAGVDVASLKAQLNLGSSGIAQTLTGLSVLSTLFTSSGTSAGDTSGAYQLVVGLIISLATIWAARQTLAGQTVRIRDAFYKGIYPLVPFVLVLLVVIVQAVPLLIGAWLYTTVVTAGIAVSAVEQILWGALALALAVVSIYMLCSSVFALYIVTLPDMTPLKALRSARQLVRYRRGQVLRKLLYLPFILLVAAAVIMLPIILFIAPAAAWIFFVLSCLALILVHLYMYTVYKALLA